MRKLLISSLTLAMLLVNSLNVFAAETSEDQTTNVDVPLGVTSEHTMDVESIPAETAEAVLNVTFATVKGEYVGSTTVKESAAEGEGVLKTFELGTDFQLPEGYQLVSCVPQMTKIKVAYGTLRVRIMIVEKIPTVPWTTAAPAALALPRWAAGILDRRRSARSTATARPGFLPSTKARCTAFYR